MTHLREDATAGQAIRYPYKGDGPAGFDRISHAHSTDELAGWYRAMLRIRRIEEEIERRYHQDQMKTPIHLVIGQEDLHRDPIEQLDGLIENDLSVQDMRSDCLHEGNDSTLPGQASAASDAWRGRRSRA